MSETKQLPTTTAAPGNVTAARDALAEVSDNDGWRARSLCAALDLLAQGANPIEPRALAALADALGDHVENLTDAVGHAHELLTGRVAA